MSEAEKKRRLEYKKNRKKWLLIQIIIIAVVSAIVLSMSITYFAVSKTQYVDYTEKSGIDYRVQYSPNDFFDEEWQPSGMAYVPSLMENIEATFRYDMDTGASSGMNFSYTYDVTATLCITDKYTGSVFFDPVTVVIPTQVRTQSGSAKLSVVQPVVIDFDAYNDVARAFVEAYQLEAVTCKLDLTMNIRVTGETAKLRSKETNNYFTTLSFSLEEEKVESKVTSSLSNGESKTMALTNSANKNLFFVLGIVFGILDLLGGAFFFVFMYATRNHDINYAIKVKRLVSSYRSFIQAISTPFNTEGYQIIYIKSFNEMLEVRDTLCVPLLMHENEDGTVTTFVIPSQMGLLYSFEIRVDDYDDIYGISSGEGETRAATKLAELWKKVKDLFDRVSSAVKAKLDAMKEARLLKKQAKADAAAKAKADAEAAAKARAEADAEARAKAEAEARAKAEAEAAKAAEEPAPEEEPAPQKSQPSKKKKGNSNKRKTKQVNNLKRGQKPHHKKQN